jgi:hypothetical protein
VRTAKESGEVGVFVAARERNRLQRADERRARKHLVCGCCPHAGKAGDDEDGLLRLMAEAEAFARTGSACGLVALGFKDAQLERPQPRERYVRNRRGALQRKSGLASAPGHLKPERGGAERLVERTINRQQQERPGLRRRAERHLIEPAAARGMPSGGMEIRFASKVIIGENKPPCGAGQLDPCGSDRHARRSVFQKRRRTRQRSSIALQAHDGGKKRGKRGRRHRERGGAQRNAPRPAKMMRVVGDGLHPATLTGGDNGSLTRAPASGSTVNQSLKVGAASD